jgi:hypothetical protein
MLATYQTQHSEQRLALALFWRAVYHGQLHRAWARLTRHTFRLRDLKETLDDNALENSHYAGLITVELEKIQGSEGKSDAFDSEFNPMHDLARTRWTNIALAIMRGRQMPPVDLVKVEDVYYVRDGHHRISVARSLGQQYIEAEVTALQLRKKLL